MNKKRALIALAAVVGVLVITVGALVASMFIGLQGIPEDFELNDVHLVVDGFVGLGLVEAGGGKVALIDAGIDAEGTAILEALSELGMGPEAVTAIFLTHGHPDHTAASPLFPNAEVMAMAEDVDLVAGRVRPGNPLGRVMPSSPTGIEVTRPLRDLETVQVGETEVRAYHMPGHSSGSAAYLVNGLLFLGDEANASSDGKLEGTRWIVSEDVNQADASLVRLEQQLRQEGADVDAIVFAHSGVLVEGIAPLTAFAQDNR